MSVVALLQVLLGHGLLPLDGLAEQGVAGLPAAELGEVAGHGAAVGVKARKGRCPLRGTLQCTGQAGGDKADLVSRDWISRLLAARHLHSVTYQMFLIILHRIK